MKTSFFQKASRYKLSVWILGLFLVTFWLLAARPVFAHPGHGNVLPNITERILNSQLTITGLILAFLFGAFHALTPGHGKTLVTAYLVGSNSTPLNALVLSIVTTLTHTLSIFLLGLVVLFASNYLLPEQLYFVLSFLSGVTICTIGFWQLESYFNPQGEKHHRHTEENVASQSTIALGIASGLVPCSEALILLLGAIALHRVFYGLMLVISFSLGLALVLTIVGLIVIYYRHWFDRFPKLNVIQTYLPLVSAIGISLIGLILTTEAMI